MTQSRKLDPAVVVGLYVNEKLSTRRIAARLGVSHQSVHRLLERKKVPLRPVGGPPGTRLPESRRRELLQAYEDGTPMEEMRAAFGVSPGTIKRLAEQAGLPPREPGGPRRHDWGQIEQLHQQGWPSTAIAVLVGAGEGHVRSVLRDLGYGRQVAELPDVDTLKGMYAELGSVVRVAAELGVSRTRVRDALAAAGVELRARPPKRSPGRPLPDGPTLLRLYEELGTLAGVASHLRADRDRVREALVAAGWSPGRPPVPVRQGRPLPDVDTLKGMYAELGSVAKVAAELGVSRTRVRDALPA